MSTVELDDYARQAYESYMDAAAAIEDAEQRREKARQALITFMSMSDADTAQLDGVPVLTLALVTVNRFDVKRFEAAEPFKYREYLRTFSSPRLTRVRGAS